MLPRLTEPVRYASALEASLPVLVESVKAQAVAEGRFVLVQDLMSPINLCDVATAMAPGRPFGAPLWVRPTVGELPWTGAADLCTEHPEKSDDAQRADGIMADAAPCALQIAEHRFWAFDKACKAGGGASEKAPKDAEYQ